MKLKEFIEMTKNSDPESEILFSDDETICDMFEGKKVILENLMPLHGITSARHAENGDPILIISIWKRNGEMN
jgi:hypothetical protein